MEDMHGLMEENIKVCGKIIRCMVMVSSPGLTVEDMKVSIPLTRKKEEVFLYGQMEGRMMDYGKMENNKVKEFIWQKMDFFEKVSGKTEKK